MTKPDEVHTPGPPKDAEPPAALRAVQKKVSAAGVSRVGLTTTREGDWALIVRIPRGSQWPLPEVEAASGGFPVIYQYEPENLPVARPAYPDRGE
jgi:hypothetical protein